MAFEFIFESEDKTKKDALFQGDILKRNDALRDALLQAHSHYANADDYTHFMVLTQSCDLAYHGRQKPKSRYITLAAVRPLRLVVDRIVKKHKFPDFEFPFPICTKDKEYLVSQTLERLLHNTELGYFFIMKDSHPRIVENLCVFLPLSVALRMEHYEACLGAKIAQLDNVFQAKVGWLAGSIYSRVGTPDIEEMEEEAEQIKKEFMEEVIYQRTAWLTPGQMKKLKELVRGWKKENGNNDITEEVARELISQIPENIDLIAERAISKLVDENMLENDENVKRQAANILRNDRPLKRLILASSYK